VAGVRNGQVDQGIRSVGRRAGSIPDPSQYLLDWGRGYTLAVSNVGLACCAVEVVAASMNGSELVEVAGHGSGLRPPAAERVDVMVVSGTVTDKMAPAVLGFYERLPKPTYVVSFGSCANSGGPYWDSYCVTKGVDQLIPVDVYVPGCPPRPEALVDGLVALRDLIEGARP
jgi:NADH-quinone oxidoreductase subunit B